MSARIETAAAPAAGRARLAAPVLVAGCVLWLLLFRDEAAAAVQVWRDSTAFGHCFLVLPVAAWLAWERRDRLAALPPRPFAWAALAALPLALAWFAAERLGIMEGRQLAAMGLLLLLALAVLGPALWRAFAVPLLYLLFLVPFGGSLVGPLQAFTARFIDLGLDLLGIAHVVTATLIEIPEGAFRVAEACAGLRFLIAAVAFGAVYACVIYRSPGRRIAFMAVSIVVPVLANGIRALGIVVLGHVLGSPQAAAADHLVYGWIFFSIVIVLLILAGLPFRQDAAAQPRPRYAAPGPAQAGGLRAAFAAVAVLALAAAGPASAALLDRRADAEQAALSPGSAAAVLRSLTPPQGCLTLSPGSFDCGGVRLVASVRVFAAHANPGTLIAARHAATGEYAAQDASAAVWTLQRGEPRQWEVMQTSEPARLTATALWVDGQPGLSGVALRLRQAQASVFGASRPTLLLAVTVDPGTGDGARADAERAALRGFLDAQRLALASPRACARMANATQC